MEFQTVPVASIIGMFFSLIIAFAIPIGLFIFGLVKVKAKPLSFFLGCGVFLVFALILEQIFHTFILKGIGSDIPNHLWAYAIYGGLAAATFEEVGRFLAMKFAMKNTCDPKNAFMYGVGHGGFEAMVILGLSSISNIASSIAINTGMMPATLQSLDPDTLEQTMSSLSALWTTPSYHFYMGGIERISAMTLQIAMSLIMYQAVKQKKMFFLWLTFFIHFFVDATTVIMAKSIPVWGMELIVAAMACITIFFSFLLMAKGNRQSAN